MELTYDQIQQLVDALLDAFREEGDLNGVVWLRMKTHLRWEVGGGGYRELVINFISWADSRGRLRELIVAASTANPGNCKLEAFRMAVMPDFAEKLRENTRSMQTEREQAWVQMQLGNYHRAQGRLHKAVECLQRAVAILEAVRWPEMNSDQADRDLQTAIDSLREARTRLHEAEAGFVSFSGIGKLAPNDAETFRESTAVAELTQRGGIQW